MDAKYLPANARFENTQHSAASVPSMAQRLPKDFGYRGPPASSLRPRWGPTPTPQTPRGWSKPGCGCKGASPCHDGPIQLLDDGPGPGVPATTCRHFVDRRDLPPGGTVYRPMTVAFTASEFTALTRVWQDYEDRHPRPGIGIDPSTNRPWSPVAPPGLDAAERAEFVAEHRWGQVVAYQLLRSGTNCEYPQAIAAAIARDYPWLESLHARMNLGLASGSWSQELANWLLTTTSEWVCWRGVQIPPDQDGARGRFRMMGFYSPPPGLFSGDEYRVDRERALPAMHTPEAGPCPNGRVQRLRALPDDEVNCINRAIASGVAYLRENPGSDPFPVMYAQYTALRSRGQCGDAPPGGWLSYAQFLALYDAIDPEPTVPYGFRALACP